MVTLKGKKLVFPWLVRESGNNLYGFEGSQLELDTVLWQLSRLKYPYEQFNKSKPDRSIIMAVESIFRLFNERLKKKKVPWVMVVSESMPLLQAIAKITPMTWALTLRNSCFNASSVQMMELFSAKRPRDDFSPDPPGELLHEMTYTGLLVWELLTEQVYGTKGRSGQFVELMTRRLEQRKALLVTGYAPEGFTEKTATLMMRGIGERYGQTVRGLLEQEAALRHFKIKPTLPKWLGEEF